MGDFDVAGARIADAMGRNALILDAYDMRSIEKTKSRLRGRCRRELAERYSAAKKFG